MSSDHTIKTCLQVLPGLGTGGVERGTIDMAEALVNAGWRALVTSSGGSCVRELERVGGEHILLPLATKSPLKIWKNAKLLSDLIAKQSVDVVHARSRAPTWSAHLARRTKDFPLVTTFHGVYGLGLFGLKKPYNRVMTIGRPTIAISDFIAHHVVHEYGLEEDQIRIIYRGVDLDVFNPTAVTSARMIDLVTKWRLPDDGPVIMLPGRLTSWKGQTLLVDALSLLDVGGRMPADWRCLLVGPSATGSSYRSRLQAHINSKGVAGNVQIIDDCRDIAAAYMVTDVVVSASTRPEAFGRVVAEAQAMGRPVVAPAHGAAPEIMLPGVTGWLFTPGDAQSLAGAIGQAIHIEPNDRSTLAERARAHVVEYFDKMDMVKATFDTYETALSHFQK
jgi:glycosyltransferase involved in cell wall biosynthesis